MKYAGIIPARYASTRFPGKPLAMLGGKSVIQRVYEQASAVLDTVCVATDDERIMQAVESFGGRVVMTAPTHTNGTSRVCEAIGKVAPDADVVVNIQGDEPFISPRQIEALCKCFDDPSTDIATLGKPFGNDMAAIENPNSPKIVTDNRGYAMYFSRSVIPYLRGIDTKSWPDAFPFLKHIGLYAYRLQVLNEIVKLPQSPLEVAESLEQLRWLQYGYRIRVGTTDIETIGIDTPEDLKRAEQFLASRNM